MKTQAKFIVAVVLAAGGACEGDPSASPPPIGGATDTVDLPFDPSGPDVPPDLPPPELCPWDGTCAALTCGSDSTCGPSLCDLPCGDGVRCVDTEEEGGILCGLPPAPTSSGTSSTGDGSSSGSDDGSSTGSSSTDTTGIELCTFECRPTLPPQSLFHPVELPCEFGECVGTFDENGDSPGWGSYTCLCNDPGVADTTGDTDTDTSTG